MTNKSAAMLQIQGNPIAMMRSNPCRNAHGCCTVPGYALRDWQLPHPRGTWRIAHKNNNCLVNTDG
jgi:hypothetical protein